MHRPPIASALALTLVVPIGAAAAEPEGPGLCLEYAAVGTAETLDQAAEVMAARLEQAGSAEAIVVASDTGTIEVKLPASAAASVDAETVARRLGTTRYLAFRPVPAEYAHELEAGQPMPEVMAAAAPLFDGANVVGAQAGLDEFTNEPTVELRFDDEAARLLDEYAQDHLFEQIAITLDDRVISAPTLNATRFEGQVTITGGIDALPADELVATLATGALPVEVQLLRAGACPDGA